MAWSQRALAEARRRSQQLPQEVAAWKADADANAAALGIHRSQFEALKILMDGLLQKQRDLLGQLSPALPLRQFAEIQYRLQFEIVGTHDLWRVFRYILSQRQDQRVGPLVDAADLVAADCYMACMNQARAWGLVTEQEFREPPLVYLEAELSPATASRGYMVGALSFPVNRYRHLRLPIPIVVLPFDHADCVWLFCSLHHEVGHNLDQDLNLRAELKQHVGDRLAMRQVPPERRQMWGQWMGEIVADALGVLLGGAGFAHTLTSLLLMLAPIHPDLNSDDEHPHPYVRIYLVSALLRRCGVPAFDEAADLVKQVWEANPRPSWVDPYVTDCDLVADVVLMQPLTSLRHRAVRGLVPDLAGDAERVGKLAGFLGSGLLRPDPNAPTRFPWRLVPVAAQLAFMSYDSPDATAMDDIQQRSIRYLKEIERPQYLAGIDRRDFLRQLVEEIDFRPGSVPG